MYYPCVCPKSREQRKIKVAHRIIQSRCLSLANYRAIALLLEIYIQ